MGAARSPAMAYGLLAPAVVAVAFLIAYPLYLVAQVSFRQGKTLNIARITELPLGLGNYARILDDPEVWHSAWVTFVYTTGSIVPAFAIGLATALLLNRHFPGRLLFRCLILLPWAVPGVVASIDFLWLFDASYGVVNALLREAGLITRDIAWFVHADTALAAVILPTVWKCYPFFTLTLLAALQTIPAALYEAARVDGATPFQQFRHVTWPGIRSAAILAAILNTLWTLRDIDIVFAATGGGPAGATETLGLLVYHEAFSYFRMGTASAMGVAIIALSVVLVLLAMKPLKKEFF